MAHTATRPHYNVVFAVLLLGMPSWPQSHPYSYQPVRSAARTTATEPAAAMQKTS